MKALVKSEARPGIWMKDIEVPTVGPNDVLIKIAKTAICGTDMHIYDWDAWAQKTIPVPMGKARIRTQMCAGHERAQLDRAIEAFIVTGRELGVLA